MYEHRVGAPNLMEEDRRGPRMGAAESCRGSSEADPGILGRAQGTGRQRTAESGPMRTPIRLVLDTTAVHTYPSMRVGELIAMSNDDGERFGVSVVALGSTSALLGNDDILKAPRDRKLNGRARSFATRGRARFLLSCG